MLLIDGSLPGRVDVDAAVSWALSRGGLINVPIGGLEWARALRRVAEERTEEAARAAREIGYRRVDRYKPTDTRGNSDTSAD